MLTPIALHDKIKGAKLLRVKCAELTPMTHALRNRRRDFLGIYMELRDRVKSARKQAAMALRVHCREGNMRWVSLLLWAGVDPRAKVPDMDSSTPEQFMGTALEDAVCGSKIDIVRKIGIDPKKDDATKLLRGCYFSREPEIIRMLLEAGATDLISASLRGERTG